MFCVLSQLLLLEGSSRTFLLIFSINVLMVNFYQFIIMPILFIYFNSFSPSVEFTFLYLYWKEDLF